MCVCVIFLFVWFGLVFFLSYSEISLEYYLSETGRAVGEEITAICFISAFFHCNLLLATCWRPDNYSADFLSGLTRPVIIGQTSKKIMSCLYKIM